MELTEEMREKLENQGIPREKQCDDLTIVKARYNLSKGRTICGVEMSAPAAEQLTRRDMLIQIARLMKNCDLMHDGGNEVIVVDREFG